MCLHAIKESLYESSLVKKKNLENTGYFGVLNRPVLSKNIFQHHMWKKSFFLILSDAFRWMIPIFIILVGKIKDNLDTKFSLWYLFCYSITHFVSTFMEQVQN